jgi:hypothetical protein
MKMVRILIAAVAMAALSVPASVGAAPPCKDAKGRFIKCPPAPAKKQVCKDARGKFAKCGTPGAKPVG